MKILLSSLKQFVDLSGMDPAKIAADITMGGLKVDAVEYLGKGLENVVTGKIIKIDKHPDAEKLTVCTLDTAAEKLTIVCGAKNMAEGDIVPVAKIGAKLPCGLEIKPAELRGVKSHGMLCSEKELGLAKESGGLMILDKTTPPGTPFAEAAGLDDWLFDIDVTAQRGDAMSVAGVARDLCALYSKELKMPVYKLAEDASKKTADAVKIEIADKKLCPRYMARVIENLKIGPSPSWLSKIIESIGMRPVNNVVDVTNYISYMYGHPSHAFDYGKLSSPAAIIVRTAKPGEKIEAIDNKEYELNPEMLLICDNAAPRAIAGVMGGKDSEVNESTSKILIEVAVFDPVSVRKTSRKLSLASESSQRFTRGVDICDGEYIIDAIASLICELSPGAVCYAGISDNGEKELSVKEIAVEVNKLNEFCGNNFTEAEFCAILKRLNFKIKTAGAGKLLLTAPSYRHDIFDSCDIYEEFLRIYGYNNIAGVEITLPYSKPVESTFAAAAKITDFFADSGFYQCMNYSFIGREDIKKEKFDSFDEKYFVKILNPLGAEFSIMRPSMLSGLLKTMQYNINQKAAAVKIFELGNIYRLAEVEGQPEKHTPLVSCGGMDFKIVETQCAAGLACGALEEGYWNARKDALDFYYLKGVVEALFASFKTPLEFRPLTDKSNMHPKKTAALYLENGECAGYIGVLHPAAAANYDMDLSKEVVVFEIYTRILVSNLNKPFKVREISKFPPSVYDLAVLISKDVTYSSIEKACRKAGGKYLKSVAAFDEYIGERVAADKKSVAFTLTFQSDEGTLGEAETKKSFEAVIDEIKSSLGGQLRS
jgi:phenylalanyl-tRNA synthetase beta chain